MLISHDVIFHGFSEENCHGGRTYAQWGEWSPEAVLVKFDRQAVDLRCWLYGVCRACELDGAKVVLFYAQLSVFQCDFSKKETPYTPKKACTGLSFG